MRWSAGCAGLWIGGLALGACDGGGGGGRDDGCVPGDTPTLEVGGGTGGFQPIADGGDIGLVHGPQGGFHLEIGLRATHLDTSDLVTGSLVGTIDGEVFAAAEPWLDFRCNVDAAPDGALESWGTLLVYGSTPDFLDGKVTVVDAEVTDLQGTIVRTTATFTIRDTER